MASSPSHKLGQIIGYAMEEAFYDMLLPVASELELFIDRQGTRKPARNGKVVTWIDDKGNKHNLDFVLERGGSMEQIGRPAAFIESAWRRYTKHSVNKAGEIANALVPLRRTYVNNRPFLGALVAGEWTGSGLTRMESQGISVLHLPMHTIVEAFATQGIDVSFEEDTETEYMRNQVDRWDALGKDGQEAIIGALTEKAADQFKDFVEKIRSHVSRKVHTVLITSLHGQLQTASSVTEALALLSAMKTNPLSSGDLPFVRVEVQVRYSNTDKIDGSFTSLADAIMWLEKNYLDS